MALAALAAEPQAGSDGKSRRQPDFGNYFPDQAVSADVEGYVVLQCKATSEGVVSNCVVVQETPGGYGFGDAALRMSASFRMKPTAQGGVAAASGSVRVPVSFRGPDAGMTAGFTMDMALVCHGYWATRFNFPPLVGPKYLAFLFESEVKWQARRAEVPESEIEARLADARRATRKRDPMPPACGIKH